MQKGTIFVTGGAGFIGSWVIKKLLAEGYSVKCLVRSTTNLRRLQGLDIQTFVGDITQIQTLHEGMRGCAGVIHLAGLSNWKDITSPAMPDVVINGSLNVFEAAKESGNIKIVYVSSATAIDGKDQPVILNETASMTMPRNKHFAYAHAKKEVEIHAISRVKEGQHITIVSPAEVYGPFDFDRITCGNLIDFATTKTVLVPGGGTSIVHVEDVASGIVAAFEKGRNGERYILGSDNVNVHELASLTLEILGMRKPIQRMPNYLLLKMAWLSKVSGINFGFEPEVIPYAVKYFFFDNSKARTELGVTFRGKREILDDTLRWVREEGML